MALLHNLDLTGPLGDLSFYHMKGVKRPVVRTKGKGVSKAKLKNDPTYDRTRRTTSEFGGRGSVAGYIMRRHRSMRGWETHLLVGTINNWLEPLQKLDKVSEKGKRGILFSKGPRLLEGMPLSAAIGFDAIVNTPLTATISRTDATAHLTIPAMLPGVNLYLPQKQPAYRFVASLLVLPDFIYHDDAGSFEPVPGHTSNIDIVQTDWMPVTERAEPITLELRVPNTFPDERFALMLSVGIHLGTLRIGLKIEAVKNAGAAKVLAMI